MIQGTQEIKEMAGVALDFKLSQILFRLTVEIDTICQFRERMLFHIGLKSFSLEFSRCEFKGQGVLLNRSMQRF